MKKKYIQILLTFVVTFVASTTFALFACKPVEEQPAPSPGKYVVHTQYWTFYANHYEFIPNTNCIKYNGVDANSQKERVTCGDFTIKQVR